MNTIFKFIIMLITSSFVYCLSVTPYYSVLEGKNSYTISGIDEGVGWKSVLEFPFETQLQGVELEALNLKLVIASNIEKTKGDSFKDSDWIYSNSDKLTIYSESDNILNVFTLLDLSYTKEIKNIGYTIGCKSKKFEYEMYGYTYPNTNQISYNKSLTYDAWYLIPYLRIEHSSNNKWINVKNSIEYSPKLKFRDFDVHIYRNKKASIDSTDGQYISVGSNLELRMTDNIFIDIGGSYSKTEINGKQNQKFINTGEEYHNINASASNEEKEITLKLKIAK